jgi:hypothetical protein
MVDVKHVAAVALSSTLTAWQSGFLHRLPPAIHVMTEAIGLPGFPRSRRRFAFAYPIS